MTDSLRKYRDILSYSLLGVVAVSLLAALIALIDDGPFETRLSVGVVAVVAAVALATRKDDLSPHARLITFVGLGVLGVAAVLTLWGLIKVLGEDLLPAKASYVLDMLAALGFVGVALFYTVVVLRELPAPVRQPQWSPAQGGQGGQWGGQPQQGQQQGGWPAAPAQQWGGQAPQQGGWQQQAPQGPQQSAQPAAPQQGWQQYGGYAAGAAGAAAAGAVGAEAAGSAWGSPAPSTPAQQPAQHEAPAPQVEAAPEVEPAEQSTAVWSPPAEAAAPSAWQPQEQSSWVAPAAEQPAQPAQSGWGGQESTWARDAQWGSSEPAQPQAWAQEATEQPSWQAPTEYGSSWAPQAEQPTYQPEQPTYQPEPASEQQPWGGGDVSWGGSRLGDATFDNADAADATSTDPGSESASDAEQGDGRDDGQPGPSSWWSPGNGA
ncbi:hypothetical protein H4N58_15555 [Mumia sp. ZJ1417]|uniref:hypothetical protein n=1 Tax=unclassified Mumia TaxID=2621872 RepID=UPI0014245D07|nr:MULTISPECIES: hypothetical protein [unclassified Mumia]QMW65584.1 hypothetical protein H4N58_15555 [Mumia sp. ZJ1417]